MKSEQVLPTVILRPPTEKDREAVMAYRAELLAAGSEMDGTGSLQEYDDFSEWLAKLIEYSDACTVPEGKVEGTELLVFNENGCLVGMVNIRHRLNDDLARFGGHIGYSVRPSRRRKGYATAALQAALDMCRTIGLARVLVCCDRENIASAKTIQANGGILENEVFDSSHGTITQRYWIEV